MQNYKKFFLTFFIFIGITFLLRCFASTTYDFTTHNHIMLYGAVCFSLTGYLWEYKKPYFMVSLFISFLYVSIVLIELFLGMAVRGEEILDSFVFGTFLVCIYSYAFRILLLFQSKCFFKPVFVCFCLCCIPLLLFPLVFWGYFFVSHQLLSADIILTIFQTNASEAAAYLKSQNLVQWLLAGICMLALLVLNLFFIWRLSLVRVSHSKKINIGLALFFVFIFGTVLPKTTNFYAIDVMTATKQELNDFRAYGTAKDMREERLHQLKNLAILPDGGGIYVLVIGESETKNHMGVYGYDRDTTPWLKQLCGQDNTILFKHAYSNHTHTVPVLTYALSEKNQYNHIDLVNANSIIEIAKAAGYETYWISNQEKFGTWDTPVAEIASTADHQVWINHNAGEKTATQYYDEELVKKLPDLDTTRNALIIVHLMGSHVSYKDRYPESYNVFTGKSDDIDQYDNSVLYNDNVLKNIYTSVAKYPNFKAFIYFSDHGDDVDANLGHESSKFTFPMSRIPFIMCFSDSFINNRNHAFETLKQNSTRYWTNDLAFNMLVDVLGISGAPVQEDNLDIASDTYGLTLDTIKTLHGSKNIGEDGECDH